MADTPLPLSQQVLAWIITGLGYRDRTSVVSRQTLTNALQGKVIPDSWDRLVDEGLVALGVTLDPGQRAAVQAALHDLDRRISALDAHGLELADRLPAVVGAMVPALGLRFGALAALVETAAWQVPLDARGAPLPVSDWLCEPLHPAVFGRTVEAFLRTNDRSWTPWGAGGVSLERRGVASRKTIAGWRKGELRVPNVSTLDALIDEASDPGLRARGGAALRLARLLTTLRQELTERCGDSELADQAAEAVASWARATRDTLRRPDDLATLGEAVADGLGGDHGTLAWQNLGPILPKDIVGSSPAEASACFRALARQVRDTGRIEPLRWFVALQALVPSPLLVFGMGLRVGVHDPRVAAAADTLELVQACWTATSWLRAAAADPSHGASARRLIEGGRRVVHTPGEPAALEREALQLIGALVVEQHGVAGLQEFVELWNAAQRRLDVPALLEPLLRDEDLIEAPHLIPVRALRLAESGDDRAAISLISQWSRGHTVPTWPERLVGARALIVLGHRAADGLRPTRQALLALPRDLASLPAQAPHPALAKLEATIGSLWATTQCVVTALYDCAAEVLGEPADSRSRAERIVSLLPLAIRLDHLAAERADTPTPVPRARALAGDLAAALEGLPAHADAWAALAMWQAASGQDHGHAVRQATHHGAGATWARLRSQLVQDGVLVPG